jgi:hypothetical protein
MSFSCKACGQQRAGTASWPDGYEICEECRQQHLPKGSPPTQLGRAAILLHHFAPHRLYEEQIDQLEAVLNPTFFRHVKTDTDASMLVKIPGDDKTISGRRRTKLMALVAAAREFNNTLVRALESDHIEIAILSSVHVAEARARQCRLNQDNHEAIDAEAIAADLRRLLEEP